MHSSNIEYGRCNGDNSNVCCKSSSGSGSALVQAQAQALVQEVEVAQAAEVNHQAQVIVGRRALEVEHKVCAAILQRALRAISNTGDARVMIQMCAA